jgi:4-amino-4-deoxy-L-arabinose transferase-like glycosyltransferase
LTRARSHLGPLALLAAVVLAITLPGLATAGLGWSDAPNHVFDGIFVRDFLADLPLDRARQWAEEFYLRHPSLGLVVYYPPGFAVVEAACFALFGVSLATAHLAVLAFALGAAFLMYLLGSRWWSRPAGLFAALLLLTTPHGALWAVDVMLEWPATFWILAAIYAHERDRQAPGPAWSIALSAALVLAFLTKQTAGFIFPVLVLHAALQPRPIARAWFARRSRIVALVIAAAIICAYLLATRSYAALPAQLLRPSLSFGDAIAWAPEILGWPFLPVAGLGLVGLLLRRDRGPRGLLLLWFLAWTGFCVAISAREPRYFFFSLPPLAFAAARLLCPDRPAAAGKARLTAGHILLSALVLTQFALARWKAPAALPRYDGPVEILAARPDADIVLVDAVRDGQFVFDLYVNPATRDRVIPFRASKLLYARAARERYSYRQFVHSPQDILSLLDRYAIRYVVIESAYPRTPYAEADPPPRRMLRELLAADPRFRLVRAWPLRCGDPAWNEVQLHLYEYPSCPPRASRTLRLSFPAMNREVEIALPPPR